MAGPFSASDRPLDILSKIPLASFLLAYPWPAFCLSVRRDDSKFASPLQPILTNVPYQRLILGFESPFATGGWLEALVSVAQTKRFTAWIDAGTAPHVAIDPSPFTVTLKPPWFSAEAEDVSLELVKTRVDDYWIVTSTARSEFPLPKTANGSTSGLKQPSIRRLAASNMRISNFPPPARMSRSAASPTSSVMTLTPSFESIAVLSPVTEFEPSSERVGEIQDMLINFPWHTTPLGSRESWPQSLSTMLSVIMGNPYPAALWWGEEFVIIYNAAYADMSGRKHPRMFGQRGSVAWGELWTFLGPIAETLIIGKAVAKTDDLLFFDRLTPANLPEETYHSWSWIPVANEAGGVGGLYNTTFETTAKVQAERRLHCLRDLCEKSAFAPTTSVYAQSILDVFSAFTYDVPFAALYLVSPDSHIPDGKNLAAARDRHTLPGRIILSLSGTLGAFYSGDDDDGVSKSTAILPDNMDLWSEATASPHSLASMHLRHSPDRLDLRLPDARGKSPSTGVTGHGSVLSAANLANLDDSNAARPSPSSSLSDVATTILARARQGNPVENPIRDGDSVASTPSSGGSHIGASAQAATPPVFDWSPWIRDAFLHGKAVHVPELPSDLVQTLGRERGWNDQVREAVVVPIAAEGDDIGQAVLILGINTRTTYGSEYATWIDVMRMTLGSSLTAVNARENEIQRADQLAQLDAAKTSFFSNASHELRTPLTLIAGPLEDVISLVDDHKIEGGKLNGRFRPFLLSPFTANLSSLFRSTIEKSGIQFIVDCDLNDNNICYVDPEFWEKIVFNLIGNAFKYTMEGTITTSIRFGPRHVTFSVVDSGVGIPKEDIDKVFDRFHRVYATSRSHEGTGIGLALTRELVKLHGGTLSVVSSSVNENEHDHGSTFTVVIPLGHDHLPQACVNDAFGEASLRTSYGRGIIDEASQWLRTTDPTSASTPSDASENGSSLSSLDSSTIFFAKSDIILIVDDNSDMRSYIKSIFTPYCAVLEACDGQEALDIMTSNSTKPNIVISDAMMPVLDGFGLLAAMRSRPDLRLIPVIMVTAHAGDEARLESLINGADDHCSKPFTARSLLARTHLHLQLGKRRAELEAKFEASTRNLASLSELAPVGIFRVNAEGRLTYTNSKWHQLTGVPKDCELDDWTPVISDEDRPNVLEFWKRVFETRHPGSIEFKTATGAILQTQVDVLPEIGHEWPGILGTVMDISERRILQETQLLHAQEQELAARRQVQEAEQRREEAEQQRRSQELLIDVTSHELRQPVSAILNCASLVRSNLQKLRNDLRLCLETSRPYIPEQNTVATIDEDLGALDAIYQCGLSQERISNDVLSLSRMQLEVLSILPVDFNIANEVKRVCGLFANELTMKHIEFTLVFGESVQLMETCHIRADKERFAQVVTNLLSNAIKFTDISVSPQKTIRVQLDIALEPPQDGSCRPSSTPSPIELSPAEPHPVYIYVAVQDSGPGLKPADLALLFQRFSQGSNSHEVFGGSGLGLFVSRKLCELMDGRIEVSSEYGQGATFRFFIQASVVLSPKATRVNVLDVPPQEERVNEPLHVLITEDNQINQTVLNRQLKKAHCTTVLASNGVEAISALKAIFCPAPGEPAAKQFDVILMDCEMPVMDGYTAVREIRKMEASGEFSQRSFVIALTGNARSAQVQSARDAGMDDVMIKPYKIDALLSTMRRDP